MTEDIEAIAKRLVIGRKRDGRSVYDAQAKDELVGLCRRPGVSLAKTARICGINPNVLSHWVRLEQRGRTGVEAPRGDVIEMPAASAFVPMQIAPAALPPPPSLPPPIDVQVKLPNGCALELRGIDADRIVGLVEALGRLRCSASTTA